MTEQNNKLGYSIFHGLEQNEYLREIYAPIPDLIDKKEYDKIERKRRVRNERTKT